MCTNPSVTASIVLKNNDPICTDLICSLLSPVQYSKIHSEFIVHIVIGYEKYGFLFILHVSTLNYVYFFCCRTLDDAVMSVLMRKSQCRRDQ